MPVDPGANRCVLHLAGRRRAAMTTESSHSARKALADRSVMEGYRHGSHRDCDSWNGRTARMRLSDFDQARAASSVDRTGTRCLEHAGRVPCRSDDARSLELARPGASRWSLARSLRDRSRTGCDAIATRRAAPSSAARRTTTSSPVCRTGAASWRNLASTRCDRRARAHGERVTLRLRRSRRLQGRQRRARPQRRRRAAARGRRRASRQRLPETAVCRPFRRRRVRGRHESTATRTWRSAAAQAAIDAAGAAVLDRRAGGAGRRRPVGLAACAARRPQPRRADPPRRSRAARRQAHGRGARRRVRAGDGGGARRPALRRAELRRAIDEGGARRPLPADRRRPTAPRIVGVEALLRWTHPVRGADRAATCSCRSPSRPG